jgi:hypothetical protein
MNYLELKSPHDGALLILEITDRFHDSVEFNVQVKTGYFSGSASSSTFMAAPLETWFQSMADDWAGWIDEKKWGDLESRVQLSATADKTGHIKVNVFLAGQDYDSQLRVNIMFEAGQLDDMAHDVARLFA